jgi:hypothetical protein
VRRLALILLALAGCAHAEHARTHATARLAEIVVTGSGRGELALLASYRLDGLPWGAWQPKRASITVSLDDVPFASVVAVPRLLPGDRLELPIALAFTRPPRDVAARWEQGRPIRVRLRGRVYLDDAGTEQRIPTDVEAELVLPPDAVPPARG